MTDWWEKWRLFIALIGIGWVFSALFGGTFIQWLVVRAQLAFANTVLALEDRYHKNLAAMFDRWIALQDQHFGHVLELQRRQMMALDTWPKTYGRVEDVKATITKITDKGIELTFDDGQMIYVGVGEGGLANAQEGMEVEVRFDLDWNKAYTDTGAAEALIHAVSQDRRQKAAK